MTMTRALPLLLMWTACAARPPVAPTTPTPPPPKPIELEPMRIDVVDTEDGLKSKTYDAAALLDDGNDALLLKRYDEALAAYDHLLADFPESKLVIPALYNSALALQGKSEWLAAADRFRRLIALAPAGSKDVLEAQMKLGAVLAEGQRFGESAEVYRKVLLRDDLQPPERIEALARLGFALVETKDYAAAEDILRSGLAYFREISGTTNLDNTYYVAMAQFYLAEIPRRQFDAIPLRYPEAQLEKDVDQKGQLFLLARDRYVKTVDFRSGYWATAAVYQIGAMYKQYWEQWMAVPIPSDLSPEESKEYVKQVNEQEYLRKLLEKSILFHERNVSFSREKNVQSEWSDASAKEVETVRALLARQMRGDYIVPGAAASPDAGGRIPGGDHPASYVPSRFDL
jgi:tetratricopeptide (TPR) repeat protein